MLLLINNYLKFFKTNAQKYVIILFREYGKMIAVSLELKEESPGCIGQNGG